MANTNTGPIFRVGGSYTRISWTPPNGTAATLAYVDVIRETGPKAVAAPQAIQPLDQEYPIEIALPGALEAGSIEIQFREQWNVEVWDAFYQTYTDPINGSSYVVSDLLGLFKAQLNNANKTVNLEKLIIDPTSGNVARKVIYVNPTIVNATVDETVNIGTMTLPKSIMFMYTQRQVVYSNNSGIAKGSLSSTFINNPNSLLGTGAYTSGFTKAQS